MLKEHEIVFKTDSDFCHKPQNITSVNQNWQKERAENFMAHMPFLVRIFLCNIR